MNWKRWKLGLCVSTFTGLLTGLAAWASLTAHINGQDFLKLLALNITSHTLMYLTKHPVDSISTGDTTIITKP